MHPILRYSTEPIDIQFGDIKWNDSIPIVVTPSTSPSLIESGDEQQLSSIQNDSHEPATRLSTSPLSEATNPVVCLFIFSFYCKISIFRQKKFHIYPIN